MSYYENKYLKYKNKYLELRQYAESLQYGSGPNAAIDAGIKSIVDAPSCSKDGNPLLATNGILDLDCIQLSLEPTELLTKKCLDDIREAIQSYYDDFYNYLCFPNKYGNGSGFEYKEVNMLTNGTVKKVQSVVRKHKILTYSFPIIDTPNMNNKGLVDYDLLIESMVNNKAFEDLINEYKKLSTLLLEWLTEINSRCKSPLPKVTLLDFSTIYDKFLTENNITKTDDLTHALASLQDINSLEILSNLINVITVFTFNNNLIQSKDFDKIKSLYKAIQALDIPDFLSSNGMIEKIFGLQTIHALDKLNIAFEKEAVKKILKELLEAKRVAFSKRIEQIFVEESSNKLVVEINLWFFTDLSTFENNGHANSLVIYKYSDGTFLSIRTEPHRHTNIYCRNSVRKAIREIFRDNDKFSYKDYVIESKYKIGLQVHEEKQTEIDFKNETDYDKLEPKYKLVSPLQGNSGFCASWTMYTTMLLLLNQDKSLKDIGLYLGSFYLNTGDKDNYDTLYTLYKHIKLYRAIVFACCFISRTMGPERFKSIFIQSLLDKGVPNDATNKLLTLLAKFETQFDKFDEKLKLLSTIQMAKPVDILTYDTHYCEDSLFDHKQFCVTANTSKTITAAQKDKYRCKDVNITLIGIEQASKDEQAFMRQVYSEMKSSSTSQPVYTPPTTSPVPSTPAPSTPAPSTLDPTPAPSTPAPSTPAPSMPAPSMPTPSMPAPTLVPSTPTPASSTPASSTPASSTPAPSMPEPSTPTPAPSRHRPSIMSTNSLMQSPTPAPTPAQPIIKKSRIVRSI